MFRRLFVFTLLISGGAGLKGEKTIVPNDLFMKEYSQKLSQYTADIFILGTGVLIENPLHDVRFMFLSKEGIQLPDETGAILEELKKLNPDFQKINRELWDQGIVWPIAHYAAVLESQ